MLGLSSACAMSTQYCKQTRFSLAHVQCIGRGKVRAGDEGQFETLTLTALFCTDPPESSARLYNVNTNSEDRGGGGGLHPLRSERPIGSW
jgi:hypothetical protein